MRTDLERKAFLLRRAAFGWLFAAEKSFLQPEKSCLMRWAAEGCTSPQKRGNMKNLEASRKFLVGIDPMTPAVCTPFGHRRLSWIIAENDYIVCVCTHASVRACEIVCVHARAYEREARGVGREREH